MVVGILLMLMLMLSLNDGLCAGAEKGGQDEVRVRESVDGFNFEVGSFDVAERSFTILFAPI